MTENVKEATIILCGGSINYINLPVGTNTSNAMIPINGKPVIGWILDDLIQKGITKNIIVVLRKQDERLHSFLNWAYGNRLELKFAILDEEGTIIQSLKMGLSCDDNSNVLRVILGDTLIKDSYVCDDDFFYISPVKDSHRWCVAEVNQNGEIIDFYDKQELEGETFFALAGYYQFSDIETLMSCVNASLDNNEKELSDVFRKYIRKKPVIAKMAQNWYDFGHIENLVTSKHRLLQPRFFNTLEINPVLNTITKTSNDQGTLQDELDWYLNVPDELKVLAPRLVSYEKTPQGIKMVEEYYGYPTLAELYVYSNLSKDAWRVIMQKLLSVHNEFLRYPKESFSKDIIDMYLVKTRNRLEMLVQQDQEWLEVLNTKDIVYNKRYLRNLSQLKEEIETAILILADRGKNCIIHGDFCFSNILFDVSNQIIRLIDPRGRFGKKGIYGDPRYDIAKLSHSVHGLYDFIIADMFEINKTSKGYEAEIFSNHLSQVVSKLFDLNILNFGYDLKEIRLIEGLLFISMLPIHYGHPKRQMMMYLTGLLILNEVFDENCY